MEQNPALLERGLFRMAEFKTHLDNVEKDAKKVQLREMQAMLLERGRKRFEGTLHQMEMQAQLCMEQPFTLEDIPVYGNLVAKKAKKKKPKKKAEEDEEYNLRPKLPFLQNPTLPRNVTQSLHNDLKEVDRNLRRQRLGVEAPQTARRVSSLKEKVEWGPASARGAAVFGDSETKECNPEEQTFESLRMEKTESRGVYLTELVAPRASKLRHDPQEFIELRKQHHHDRSYVKGKFRPTVDSGSSVHDDSSNAADQSARFAWALQLRTHEFNEACLSELRRALDAQHEFLQVKKESLHALMDDEKLMSAPLDHVIAQARRKVFLATRRRDNAERLDVFFNHIEALREHCVLTLQEPYCSQLLSFLDSAEMIVCYMKGEQKEEDFDMLVDYHFGDSKEQFYLAQISGFCQLVAPMFGLDRALYRDWHMRQLQEFETKDIEEKLREKESELGYKLTPEADFRVVILEAHMRNLIVAPNYFVRLDCEKHRYSTSVSQDPHPVWNEPLQPVHMNNSASTVWIRLFDGAEELCNGSFSITAFGLGRVNRLLVPLTGAATSEVALTIQLFERKKDRIKEVKEKDTGKPNKCPGWWLRQAKTRENEQILIERAQQFPFIKLFKLWKFFTIWWQLVHGRAGSRGGRRFMNSVASM